MLDDITNKFKKDILATSNIMSKIGVSEYSVIMPSDIDEIKERILKTKYNFYLDDTSLEKDIRTLLSNGYSEKEISEMLSICVDEVKRVSDSIMNRYRRSLSFQKISFQVSAVSAMKACIDTVSSLIELSTDITKKMTEKNDVGLLIDVKGKGIDQIRKFIQTIGNLIKIKAYILDVTTGMLEARGDVTKEEKEDISQADVDKVKSDLINVLAGLGISISGDTAARNVIVNKGIIDNGNDDNSSNGGSNNDDENVYSISGDSGDE